MYLLNVRGNMVTIEQKILDLRTKGWSVRRIAQTLNMPKSTVFDIITRAKNVLKVAQPRILILDIETAPTLAWTWRRFKENIGQNQVVQEGYVLTWSAKWLGEDNVVSDSLHNYPLHMDAEDDKPLIASIYKLLDEADVVIAHNGDRFDMPTLNSRMVYHGFNPPKPYKTVDTLKILKNKFRFPSNSLNSVCEYLGLGNKVDTGGFELWARCMRGDIEAFKQMLEYNVYDVVLLEELYIKIAPWYTQHVNISNFKPRDKMACTVCTSTDLKKDGTVSTNVSIFDAYQCQNCGHWNRGRVNIKTKDEMKATVSNAL